MIRLTQDWPRLAWMISADFKNSLTEGAPPLIFAATLRALWWDARGNWSQAHAEVDELETVQGMAVHAYLHRKEGKQPNAAYWYGKAGRPFPLVSLAEEWEILLDELLSATTDPRVV